ncbi:heterokaryon incompatibility protein-domain-containing protein [Phaeosphaeriaceae sp. PMI808]|nr:heterokaryon incompatibility protein-domain-containing protein [Phaeosphaeriaceae sp. PMI808]
MELDSFKAGQRELAISEESWMRMFCGEPIDSTLQLCSYCRHYMLRRYAALQIRDDPGCPSCELIASAFLSNATQDVAEDIRIRVWHTAMPYHSKFTSVDISFVTNDDSGEEERAGSTLCIKTLCENIPVHIPAEINFESCIAWLTSCKHEHGPECEQKNLPSRYLTPLDIILVDVIENRIDRRTTASKYFALSYVWGGAVNLKTTTQNFGSHHQPGYLANNSLLPQTVADAILLTRHMGVRYLWVDCICVVQDSTQKHQDLANMDVIFSQAELTIVAAGSEDADSGLPGVRCGTRRRRITSKTQGSNVLELHFPSDRNSILQGTRYEARAWIYQELLMSKRLLFVMENQAIFHCDRSQWSESRPQETPHEPSRIGFGHNNLQSRLSLLDDSNRIVRSYFTMVKEYTKKQLSFTSDIENAFAGLASIIQHWCEGDPIIHGLMSSFFGYSMMWAFGNVQPVLSHQHGAVIGQRRAGFPSWSWVGWIASASFIGGEPLGLLSLVSSLRNIEITIHSEVSSSTSFVVMDRSTSNTNTGVLGQRIQIKLEPIKHGSSAQSISTLAFDAERTTLEHCTFEAVSGCDHLVAFALLGATRNSGFLFVVPDSVVVQTFIGRTARAVSYDGCDYSIVQLYQLPKNLDSLSMWASDTYGAFDNKGSQSSYWDNFWSSGLLFVALIRRCGVYWERIGSGLMMASHWPSSNSDVKGRAYQERIVII